MAYVTNASEMAYRYLLEQIEREVWRAGDRIWTEAWLCEHLHISRVAVRQAIDRLVAQNLVYKKQGSGTYIKEAAASGVRDIGLIDADEEDIMDILEFRRYFEQGNMAMFIQNAGQEDIQALEEENRMMYRASGEKDMRGFYAADYRFHNTIARGTRKRFIFRISATLSNVLLRHQENLNAYIGVEIGLEYHKLLMEAAYRRDTDLAVLYMRRHIDASIEAMRAHLQGMKQEG